MSRYQKRIEELRQKFGLSNGLELAGQFQAPPKESSEAIVNRRAAQEKKDKAAGWHTCKGGVEVRERFIPMSLGVRF